MQPISQKDVEKCPNWLRTPEGIATMQGAIFAMCGGGLLGRSAVEQPADFYIDDRVGKLPYPKKAIVQAVKTLVTVATLNGLNPHNMKMAEFHNCGIF